MKTITVNQVEKSQGIVKTLVTDLSGGFREIIFPAKYIGEIVKNGVAYDGSSFTGINTINSSDSILIGVPETLIQVPDIIADSEKPEFWIIGNIHAKDGRPHPNCARHKCLEMQSKLAEAWNGGKLFVGAEPEAYFVKQDSPKTLGQEGGENANYFNPKDEKSVIITDIANVLDEIGYEIERAHTEVGTDQFEINWKFDRAERTADKIQIYKLIAHKIARLHGYEVSFLPKPYPSRNGSGMHCHLSVQNPEKNLFYVADGDHCFSAKALNFLEGILQNTRSLSAIANPTEVSYARLVPGYEAPCVVAIGDCNRSAACRIPAIADPDIVPRAIRAEFRFPDPMANPYLLMAGFAAAGILGIQKSSPFRGFCSDDLFSLSLAELTAANYTILPRNCWEAYQELNSNNELMDILGADITHSHLDILLDEIDTCQKFANTKSIERHYLA